MMQSCVDLGGNHNARIPGYSDLFAHIEGYKRAADLVWAAIKPNPRAAGIDYLVYPMIFLYRYFVELSLKDIIATGSHLEGGPGTSRPATTSRTFGTKPAA